LKPEVSASAHIQSIVVAGDVLGFAALKLYLFSIIEAWYTTNRPGEIIHQSRIPLLSAKAILVLVYCLLAVVLLDQEVS